MAQLEYTAEVKDELLLELPEEALELHLQPGQVTGFYYAMQNTIDRIKEAETLIDTARKQPELLPA